MSTMDDPFATPEANEDDPFATSEDVKGGGFNPRPFLEDLEGRLIVMIPRTLDENAPDPFAKTPGGTREQYTVDLAMLTGGPLTFTYKNKRKDGDSILVTDEETTVPEGTLWTRVYIPQASLIAQLKKTANSSRPLLLGILRRGPQAEDRRGGKTFQDIEKAFATWRKNPKGAAPKFSWQVDVDSVTPAQKEIALKWWRAARENGLSL